MISSLNSPQRLALDQMNRAFTGVYTGGFSGFINDILGTLQSGAIGIQSAAADVDSLSLGGGAFTQNADTTSGLTFGFNAGRLRAGQSTVSIPAGTVALTASSTNYIEADPVAAAVAANTAGFTPGRVPLYVVVAGVSLITSVTNAKVLLGTLASASVSGALLTPAGATKEVGIRLPTLSNSAPTIVAIRAPYGATTLLRATFVSTTAVAASDTVNYTFGLVNKGQAGAGAATLVNAATAANSNKATGGAAIAAYAKWPLTLVPLTAGTERSCASEDALQLTITPAGTPAAIADASLWLDFGFTN